MENNNDFEFNYSAPSSEERREIESIRNSYLAPKESETKLDYLRRLDFKVKNIPMIWALIIGVVGTLIFGLGMSMVLEWKILAWGIVVCAVSLVPILMAYPTFKIISKSMKDKYTNEILKISEELLNNEK